MICNVYNTFADRNCEAQNYHSSFLPAMPPVCFDCPEASGGFPTSIATHLPTGRVGIVNAELTRVKHVSWQHNGLRFERELGDFCQACGSWSQSVECSPSPRQKKRVALVRWVACSSCIMEIRANGGRHGANECACPTFTCGMPKEQPALSSSCSRHRRDN